MYFNSIRQIQKEIVLQYAGNTPQQINIYIFFTENLIDIGTSTT